MHRDLQRCFLQKSMTGHLALRTALDAHTHVIVARHMHLAPDRSGRTVFVRRVWRESVDW